jgi:ATP-binding cassette subfamily B (MDR/TAP) protein 1
MSKLSTSNGFSPKLDSSQEPTLFGTSVKENVAHGLIGTEYEDTPQEQKDALIKEACIKLNADGFITQLPNQRL